MNPDLLSVAIRTLAFACLYQAGGAAWFVLLFGARLPNSTRVVRGLGVGAALIGVVLLAAHQEMEAARMADDFSGLLDVRMQGLAWRGGSGAATLIQVVALLVIAVGLSRQSRAALRVACVGAIVTACASVLTGHTSVHPQRALLAPLLALHVLLGSFWFGALLPLIISVRRENREDAVTVLRAFSAVAGPLVPCIAVAGLVMSQTLLAEKAQWQTTYAALLITKMILFLVLLGLAAWNRWRALPALAGADSRAMGPVLRRLIAVEYGLIVGVFAVTAVMTTFYSP